MKRRIPVGLIMFVSGMLTALPIMFPKAFVIGAVSFALPAYIEYTASGKASRRGRTYLRGLAFFEGFGVVLFSWFCAMYPLEFTGLSPGGAIAVVCAGWFGLSLLQSLFWAFMFPLSRLISKYFKTESHPLVFSLVFSCIYVIFEWMSTKTWAGVPWGRLAVGQTEFLPMIQISSVVGGYGVSFVLVFFGCAIGVSIAEYRKNKARISLRPLAAAALILAGNIGFGTVRLLAYEPPEDSEKVTMGSIQGNISSHERWSEDSLGYTEESYMALSLAAAKDGAEILVLPETPIVYNMDGSWGNHIKAYYEKLARTTGCTVITGAFTKNNDNVSENSVVVFDPELGLGENKYIKRHLVPFGEYVPMRDFVSVIYPPLSSITMLENDLAEGEDPVIIETDHGKIAPLICFDSIYETLAIDSVRAGGELFTLSTNDSWFLDSAAVWEHNRHAVLRSVECGRYTVRSANTGVSSVISPTGDIMEYLPPLEDGYVTADVHMINENTVYATVGNLFIPICAAAVIAVAVYCKIKNRSSEEI